jgi:prepilin-type processing-associated H-X9-DG protein
MPLVQVRTSAIPLNRVPARPAGFTLLELLVVMGITVLLVGLLIPVLASARDSGRKAVCLSNLRQIGLAIHAYADDHDGKMPYGPKAPPFTSPANFYPSTGAPTSLVSLQSGMPVGLGLLLQHYVAAQPRVLFCPGADQSVDAKAELAKVGARQAQSSYYYRHASVTQLFENPDEQVPPPQIQLDYLGANRQGVAIRALAIDTLFLCPPELEPFNIKPRTHHRQKFADILFADGHVLSRRNRTNQFVVDLRNYAEIRQAFDRILRVLEQADAEL